MATVLCGLGFIEDMRGLYIVFFLFPFCPFLTSKVTARDFFWSFAAVFCFFDFDLGCCILYASGQRKKDEERSL